MLVASSILSGDVFDGFSVVISLLYVQVGFESSFQQAGHQAASYKSCNKHLHG